MAEHVVEVLGLMPGSGWPIISFLGENFGNSLEPILPENMGIRKDVLYQKKRYVVVLLL